MCIRDSFDTVEGAALIGNDLYVSDANGSDVIRRVNLQSGDVSTLVGKQRESNTVDGSFAESRFLKPGPLVAVGTTLYVIQLATEHGGACIRSIDLAAQRTATITGNCKRKGNLDGNKDTALFSSPRAMVTDGQNLYVADSVRVRAVALANGTVTTLAGEADAQCDFGFQKICKGGWVDGVDVYKRRHAGWEWGRWRCLVSRSSGCYAAVRSRGGSLCAVPAGRFCPRWLGFCLRCLLL